MTAEKALEKVLRIMNVASRESAVIEECASFVADLQAEINAAAEKKNGRRNAQVAALRILKMSYKNKQEKLTKALVASDGQQLISDGYRAIKLVTPLHIPDNTDNTVADVTKAVEGFIKMASENLGDEITPPSLSELSSLISVKRAEAKADGSRLTNVPYEIAPGIHVDALLLLDVLEILPDVVLVPSVVGKERKPLYLKSEYGCGLLCPILVRNDG